MFVYCFYLIFVVQCSKLKYFCEIVDFFILFVEQEVQSVFFLIYMVCGLNMLVKVIFEVDGKFLFIKWLLNINYVKNKFVVVVNDFNWDDVLKRNLWILMEVSLDLFG